MKIFVRSALLFAACLAGQAVAQSPAEVVAAAPDGDWETISSDDLLVMTLASKRRDPVRQVVIQLAPAPFSQGWVDNIRTLAKAHWWDGLAVTRVQDNYVTQWGDPEGENPAKARPLPNGLRTMAEGDYIVDQPLAMTQGLEDVFLPRNSSLAWSNFYQGWPVAGVQGKGGPNNWLVHCYGMVGVGRNLSPDTGTGAELYTVIGHAPRHLDRNIALVGRVVMGMEHLSALPRGTGPLGVYTQAKQRTGILKIRLASELPIEQRPRLAVLRTQSASFLAYAQARANRRDAFFNVPAGGADICNIPIPVRQLRAGQ